VRSKEALIFLDSGFEIILVTSSLADYFQAPRIKCKKIIKTVQDQNVMHSNYAVRLVLEARSGKPEEDVIIYAHIVEEITALGERDLTHIK